MINEEVLKEKLKYLISMNAKSSMFQIMNLDIEFEFTNSMHDRLMSYDIDVKFDYEGAIDFDLDNFTADISKMARKFESILEEYVINQEGKIVAKKNSNCYPSREPLVFSIDYKADERHIFDLGYRFSYSED